MPNWIEREIAELNPATESARIVLLSANRLLPRYGGKALFNLLYCLGFLRVSGQLEGALAVDRAGAGKVHRNPDKRAEETISHFLTWISNGAASEESIASLERVRRMHEHYERDYSFSNETLVHTIALFTVQFDHLLRLVGARGYTEIEKKAQVAQWRAIGAALGVQDMPDTWEGMEDFLTCYETDASWFGPSPAAYRCANSLIAQLTQRWVPRGFRWSGRLVIRCLLGDRVLWATGQRKPMRPIVWLVRRTVRAGLFLNDRLLPPRRELIDPSLLLAARTAGAS
jgi:hypothetical protein